MERVRHPDRLRRSAPIGYQGNWRDIFQNWEALAWSHPELVDSMVLTFLNATTVDGYNPYRISHEGHRLGGARSRTTRGRISATGATTRSSTFSGCSTSPNASTRAGSTPSRRALCTSGDVPYRIDGYDDIVADPYDTITFDASADARARRRAATLGGDGRLVHDRSGAAGPPWPRSFPAAGGESGQPVPGGGIWMTTQRPGVE